MLYLISRIKKEREIIILTYHSVGSNNAFYTVHPREFIKQMDYLRKNYHIVTLDEIVKFIHKKIDLPKKTVAITFDDGYLDNYINAYPYFKKYKIPAMIFITTGYLQKRVLLYNIPLKTLSWNEIKEISRNNINIGAHTITHPDLQKIDLVKANIEILKSKEEIEKKIGRQVNYFAYPFGRYRQEIIDIIKSIGFKAAFTSERGLIRQGDDLFRINRVTIDSSITFLMFKARLTKAIEWYAKIEYILKNIINKLSFLSKINRIYHDIDLINRL
ncbi:MAG: polysaccharide deacetylase family protein [Candidatus Bathyarchaeota archaeon]|nr:polysaccharide deacetylase family protein [Candidatus Bathyarchaeota archaeon]